MPIKAFSIEDGNLATKSIISSQTRTYSDIDLKFAKKTTGDIFKKTNAAAVKQSIKNILMTNETEKPFDPEFGGNLQAMLFSLDTDIDEDDIKDMIISSVSAEEPRASIIDVKVNSTPDFHSINVDVVFQILASQETETLNVSLTRLR